MEPVCATVGAAGGGGGGVGATPWLATVAAEAGAATGTVPECAGGVSANEAPEGCMELWSTVT